MKSVYDESNKGIYSELIGGIWRRGRDSYVAGEAWPARRGRRGRDALTG
jgi:hypothetical protein